MDAVHDVENISSIDLQNDNKFDYIGVTYCEDEQSIFEHYEGDYEGEQGHEINIKENCSDRDKIHQLELQQYSLEEKNLYYSLFEKEKDNEEVEKVEEEVEEKEDEEEEGTHDFLIYSQSGYDLKRCDNESLNDKKRQEIINKIKELFDETKVLRVINGFLHKKYINAMRNSTSMVGALEKFDETLIFKDNRYQMTLENYANARDEIDEKRTYLSKILENLEQKYTAGELDFKKNFENLMDDELTIAKKVQPPKMNKEIWLEEVDNMLKVQRNRVTVVINIRSTYFRLLKKLENLQRELHRLDSLGPGLSTMDFEYLQKRKEIYSDRRDEQMEQIKKLEENNLSRAAAVRHVDEEISLFNEKVNVRWKDVDSLTQECKLERLKAAKLASEKVTINKNIASLKMEIGLLNYPFLLKKMHRDTLEISRLKLQSDKIKALMLANTKENSRMIK